MIAPLYFFKHFKPLRTKISFVNLSPLHNILKWPPKDTSALLYQNFFSLVVLLFNNILPHYIGCEFFRIGPDTNWCILTSRKLCGSFTTQIHFKHLCQLKKVYTFMENKSTLESCIAFCVTDIFFITE